MNIFRTCPITGKVNVRDIPVTESQYIAWRNGTLIQVAMPNLSDSDREFILTGITAEVWDEVFNED